MADSRTTAGGRDDLIVDASRCLGMRFSESSCRHCVEICPHEAITLEFGLAGDPELCRGCMLCTSVCPVGALEQNVDFYASLAKLYKFTEPILGCARTKKHSNATLACLGGLSEEHLVTLCHSLSGMLTLNLTACSDCPNREMIPHLRQRIEVLSEAGLLEDGCGIVMTESAQEINYRDESVDRRSFFKSFRTSLFACAAVIISTNNEQADRRTEYAGKRVPFRRELLNNTRKKISLELDAQVRKHFDSRISFDENCSSCQGCVAICPTGALQTRPDEELPVFDQSLCTGCCLCREFCLEGAVRISARNSDAGVQ